MTDYLERTFDLGDPGFADAYDELTLWSARFGTLLLDHVSFVPGGRILDLGCGAGFPLLELANQHGPRSRCIGADVWLQGLRRARLKLQTQRLGNVDLLLADGAHLPFADASFDLLVSNLGVNNFARPEQSLAECSRVLRRSGSLVLATNLRGHMAELYATLAESLSSLGREELLPALAEQERHRASRASLLDMVAAAGLQVVRAVDDSFVLRYVDGGAMLRHWLTRLGFLEGWRSILPPAEEATVFSDLERRLDGLAAERGELRLTVPMLYVEARRGDSD